MSTGRRPAFRLQFKDADGHRYEIGTVWESERFPGLYDVKPQSTTEPGQYPKMRMDEAVSYAMAKTGYLSLAAPKPADASARSGGSYDRPKPSARRVAPASIGGSAGGPASNSDDDVPF